MPYPRQLLVLLCLGLMEVFAGFALLTGIGLVAALPLHGALFWLLLISTWAGTAAEIATSGSDESAVGTRIAILVAALVTCVVPPVLLLREDIAGDVLSAFLLVLLFWRGMLITPKEADHYEVQRRFGLRLAFILLGIVILAARGVTESRALWLMLSLAGIGYVVSGFAALGVSRLDEARSEDTGSATSMAVGAPLVALVVLSLGALSLSTTNFLGWLGALVSPVWDVIARGIALLATILAIPLFVLLDHMSRLHLHKLPIRRPRPPHTSRPSHTSIAHHGITIWNVIGTALVVVVILVLAMLAIVLILRAARTRKPRQRDRAVKEVRRQLVTPGQMARLFLAWARGLFRRGANTAIRAVETTRHRVLGPSYPADPIRRVYAQILHRSARQGLARSPTTTPVEFELHLQSRWPEGSSHFSAVTDAYMRRRYAEQSPSEEEIRTVRNHWHRLRQVMRSRARPDTQGS